MENSTYRGPLTCRRVPNGTRGARRRRIASSQRGVSGVLPASSSDERARIATKVSTPVAQPVSVLEPAALDFASSVEERWAEPAYLEALDRGKEAIVDGEVFQVVISRRFEMECGASPLDVYRVLRNTNPSPYMYIFSLEDADGR